MNDTNRKLLDSSIIEPMPPFQSVDELIAGERRRQRMRRGVGVIATAAAVAGLVFGIQAGVGGTPRAVLRCSQGSPAAAVPVCQRTTPRTVASVAQRLSEALQDRLSTVVPNATSHQRQPPVPVDTVDGYTGFATRMSVTGPRAVVRLSCWRCGRWTSVRAPTGLDRWVPAVRCGQRCRRPTDAVDGNARRGTRPTERSWPWDTRGDGANHELHRGGAVTSDDSVRIRADNNPASGMDAASALTR